MYSSIIIDDEIKAIDLLKDYTSRIEFLHVAASFRDPVQAFSYMQQHQIDLMILDINMPVLSGIDLYTNLSAPPPVIFTTAHPEYAVDGFSLDAIDYLLKPIPFARFLQACEKFKRRLSASSRITDQAPEVHYEDQVYIKSGAKSYQVNWRDILYLEKDENYVIYHLETGKILSRQTLNDLDEIFPDYFCRIHKSYAVSLLKIEIVQSGRVKIADTMIPIGRTYKKAFQRKMESRNTKGDH